MNVEKRNNISGIFVKTDIDLKKTFECGQCFRFNQRDGYYDGVAFGKYIKIAQRDGGIEFLNSDMSDIENIWHDFFDLSNDYRKISSEFNKDKLMDECINFGYGIKILNADIFETLISFIISQNNNIPRIKKIIEKLCECYGDKIDYDGECFYTFPSAQTLAFLTVDDLSEIRAGFRAKYILDAAVKVANNEIDLSAIPNMPFESAKETLMKIKGVGEKVASCTLLFSCGFKEAFPVDVWMKKVMEKYYDGNSGEIFGKYAGVAQQYLFYYAREHKI